MRCSSLVILNLAKTIYHRSKMQVNWEEDWFIQGYMGSCVCRPRSSALTLFKEETNESFIPYYWPKPAKITPCSREKQKLRI